MQDCEGPVDAWSADVLVGECQAMSESGFT